MSAHLLTVFDMAFVGIYLDAMAETGLESRLSIGVAMEGDNSRGCLIDARDGDLTAYWRVWELIKFDALYRRQKDGKGLNDSDSYMMHKAQFAANEFIRDLAMPMPRREGPHR